MIDEKPVNNPAEPLPRVDLLDRTSEELGRATRALRATRLREGFTIVDGGVPDLPIGSRRSIDGGAK